MKPAPLLLAGSLTANAALFGVLAWQPALAPPLVRDFFKRNFHAADEASKPAAPVSPTAAPTADTRQIWAILKSDDPSALIARLRAAGFPPNVVREIALTAISAGFNSRLAALMEPDSKLPFWKITPSYYGSDPKRAEEINQLQRERSRAIRDLLRDDFFNTADVTTAQRRQFGNLSSSKIDAVQRIEDDYAEMFSQVRAGMNGVTLPVDREKLALLTREKQADLAGVLSPDELSDYTVRASPITNMLRTQLGNFDATEGEFRAIFQVQQTLSDRFPPNSAGGLISMNNDFEQRRTAQQELEAQLKSALGDARYADYQRETNRDYQQLSRFIQRDNLPAETAVSVFNLRDSVAQQSNRIFDDATLDAAGKRAALQSLAQTTRTQMLASLGPISGPAYVKIADNWLTNVEKGSAVSFTTTSGTFSSISMNNGTVAMVSMSSTSPTYRRLPGTAPTPPRQ